MVLALSVMRLQKMVSPVLDMEKFIRHIIHGLINVSRIQKLIVFNLQSILKMETFCLQLQGRV